MLRSLASPKLIALALLALLVPGVAAEGRRFPATPWVVDVTQPPYSAKGDGKTDDTAALQSALNENVGQHRILYFPPGTYLVSATLTWPKRWNGKENWGKTYLCGEDRDRSVIRLKDAVFTDPKKPQAIMWCGGFGSADWFHNYVENLTFDVGGANPGAIALQFYSNNSGAVRHCRFVAPDGSGVTGLDLAHRDMNGPLLVRECEVVGFDHGITTARAVNGQVFERITLRGQKRFGFRNDGQHSSVRGLRSENAVPAVASYGGLVLLEAELIGAGAAAKAPAVINYNGGRVFLRDVKTSGYARALADLQTPDMARAFRISGEDKPGSLGPNISEYSSQPATTAFPSAAESPRLEIKETPEPPADPVEKWANAERFGADTSGKDDSTAAIQKAVDSGATSVFLPGKYRIASTVVIRGNVRRIVGTGGLVSYGKKKDLGPDFRVEDGSAPIVWFEHFAYVHGGIEIATKRILVFRSMADTDLTMTPAAEGGEIFGEDFVTHRLRLRRQRMWARQLNVENEGTHVSNDSGDLWVLGYKTERGGTLLETKGGGRSEVLGGFSYTTTAGKLAPMFVNEGAAVWTWFGEVCYNRDPFATLVRETRGGETKTIERGAGGTWPYSGR